MAIAGPAAVIIVAAAFGAIGAASGATGSSAAGTATTPAAHNRAVRVTPRPPSERVPAGITSVQVKADLIGGRAFPLSTLSAPDSVARLIAFLDSRPLLPAGVRSCPAIGPMTILFELRFLRSDGARPAARAAEDGCGGLRFSIGSHREPTLEEGSPLADLLWRLHALPVCAARQLQASASLPGPLPARPELAMQLTFRNTSSAVCSLRGFARIGLRDSHDRPLPSRVTSTRSPPYVVTLAPRASAFIDLTWPVPRGSCRAPRAAFLSVRLPGVAHRFLIGVGSAARRVAPCGGRIRADAVG